MLTTNRKFSKVTIDGLLDQLDHNRLVEIIRKHGQHITKFFLFQSNLNRLDLFVEMLNLMPNLEHIILYSATTTCNTIPADDKLPELNKLKSLEAVTSDYNVIACFKRAKLAEFKLLNDAFVHNHRLATPDYLLDLLRSQHELKTLALRSIDYDSSTLFQSDIMDGRIKFQLTRLSLLDIKLRESPNDYNNLLKFLKPQARTIKFLEMGRSFPDLVYEFVFAKFKSLRCLRLMINELPGDMEFYQRLEESQSIVQLIFMDSPPPNHLAFPPPSLEKFIQRVPNVTHLTLLDNCDRPTLQFIAANLTNLKQLAVTYFSESVYGDITFPSLTTLCIQGIEDDVDWDKFTKNNPTISELSIHTGGFAYFTDWSENDSNFLEKITKNLRLHTLRFGSSFRANELFYDNIRTFGTELRVIDLHESCALDAHKMRGIPGLVFHDDDMRAFRVHDLELWNDDDYDGRLPEIDKGGNWADDGENFLDPFDMHLMDIDDYDEYDEYDQQDGFDDGYDDFVDGYDSDVDYD